MLKQEQKMGRWLVLKALGLATLLSAFSVQGHVGTRDPLLGNCESNLVLPASASTPKPAKKRFEIGQRHHDRVKRINDGVDSKEDTGKTFARIDEEHGTVVLTPYIDPPMDAKFMVLALHGFGSNNSNASTMARVGEMMAGKADGNSQKKVLNHEGYFPVVFESIDQPTCGGGLDEAGNFREGGGPTAEDVPDLQSMINWVVSYAEGMMRRNPGLPLMIVTRSSSAMFGVAAARIFKDRGIPVPVFTTSATLPGTQEIDRKRIEAGSEVLHKLAAEGEFALHKPSLEWVDRLMLELDWTPETFAGLDVHLMVGREDQEVVAYERARYREFADANSDTVHFEDLPNMKHNLFDIKRPYGLNTYYALYDFMNEMLKKQRDPEAYARAKLEIRQHRQEAIRGFLHRHNADSESEIPLAARELSDLQTVAISVRNQVPVEQATANVVLLHDLGTDVGHVGALEETLRHLHKIAPNLRVEAPNLPGSIDEASPDYTESKSMDDLVEWLELYLRQKKEEAPHLPLFVYTQGASSLIIAALNNALANFRIAGVDEASDLAAQRQEQPINEAEVALGLMPIYASVTPSARLIDGIIIDNGLATGTKTFAKFEQKARGKILNAGTKAAAVFDWLKIRAKEAQWTPNFFGPELKPIDLKSGEKKTRNRWDVWKDWATRYGSPAYVLFLSGGANEFMVKEDTHAFSSYGNMDRPNVLRVDLPKGGRNSWFNDDAGRSATFILDFMQEVSATSPERPLNKREFQEKHR